MSDINYLVKQRDKALGVFRKVKTKLQDNLKQMDDAMQIRKKRIDELEKQKKVNNDDIVYLAGQKEKTAKTIEKLSALL